jgi:hypothetical protein
MTDLVLGETRTAVPVREKDGSVRRIPNPATPREPLPPEGTRVVVDVYWLRRDADGDVTWPEPVVKLVEPISVLTKSPKKNARRARGDS